MTKLFGKSLRPSRAICPLLLTDDLLMAICKEPFFWTVVWPRLNQFWLSSSPEPTTSNISFPVVAMRDALTAEL